MNEQKFQKDLNLFMKSQGISSTTLEGYKKYTNQYNGYINPHIIEERQLNVASMDIFSRLIMDRIIYLGSGINDDVSNIITGQLLYLNSIDQNTDISLYINSGGGGIYAGYSILDTMEFIKPKINTIVTGIAASMAYVLSISGDTRSCLKHSRLMQHQPLGGVQGQATEIEITYKQIQLLKNELYEIISDRTGQPLEKVAADCERDYWMTSFEAKEYGAIDKIIGVD